MDIKVIYEDMRDIIILFSKTNHIHLLKWSQFFDDARQRRAYVKPKSGGGKINGRSK